MIQSTMASERLTPKVGGSLNRSQEPCYPDAENVLVADNPDELDDLRSKHGGSSGVNIILRWSEEYRQHLQRMLDVYGRRMDQLRARYGPDFEDWEKTKAQMDVLMANYEACNGPSPELYENFSKYGYSSVVRSHDGKEKVTLDDSDLEYPSSRTVMLFDKPVILQYFCNSMLWRSSRDMKVSYFEQFLDLVYGTLLRGGP